MTAQRAKMSNYKDLSAEECASRIENITSPLILIHVRPDGDCIGSACALAEIFRQLGEDARIACADKIPERLEFILEKTGFKLTDDYSNRASVSIDVASENQLGALLETAPKPVLMIDHHMRGSLFADRYIIPDMSSAAEVLYQVFCVLEKMGKVKMTEALAYALYTAISSDTGCFCYSNAAPNTYRLAAELIEFGIDAADINHRLFNSKSREQIRAEGIVASGIRTAFDGHVAYSLIALSDMKEAGLTQEHFETAIDIVRAVRGALVAFIVRELPDGKFKVSLRSVGADVASIAARHNGGGHIRAAGCTPDAASAEETAGIILHELEPYFKA